jgi:predicted nucleic acid-binding protein
MRTALDSSVLLLLARKQPGWQAWRDRLQTAASEGELLISPIAFAEFSIGYPDVEAAQADLDRLHIVYDPITPAAAYLAGQIFLRYRRSGGPRLNLIPDFLIAAHASVQADRLAALDRGYLRAYFPSLPLLAAADATDGE